jgi:NAD-dependent dihydropyrimidine dehydrogenase PreA subunit
VTNVAVENRPSTVAGGVDLTALLRWVAEQPDPPTVELVCCDHESSRRGLAATAVVRLPGCALALTVASYVEIAASGLTALSVRTDGCPRAAEVATTVAEAARLLAACPSAPSLTCSGVPNQRHRRDVFPLHRLPVSRRRLLTLGLAMPAPLPDVTADERSRTRAALRRLGAEGGTPAGTGLATVPAHAAALAASRCTGCGVCVKACPADALRLDRTGAAFALLFQPAACTDCLRCSQLCPEGSLLRTGRSDWAQVLDGGSWELATGRSRLCARCGASFADGGSAQLCPVCTYRRGNPFGSHVVAPGEFA